MIFEGSVISLVIGCVMFALLMSPDLQGCAGLIVLVRIVIFCNVSTRCAVFLPTT